MRGRSNVIQTNTLVALAGLYIISIISKKSERSECPTSLAFVISWKLQFLFHWANTITKNIMSVTESLSFITGSQYMNGLTERKIALGLWFKCMLLKYVLCLISKHNAYKKLPCAKAIMPATWSEGAGNTNHFTHPTHALLPVYKEHLPSKQSIHAGYYYSWGMQWEGQRLHACKHAHTRSLSIYSASCSCVFPAGRWGF